ncbi:hypothetical protein G5T42_02520 [Microbacterium sp. 4R-513]|uniref:hypothetical protein n=1 Tax=Microbacterium sp. 4R-513 TaxID=2567934 RepID=UPI0013E1B984|nr:hypothetical protein [Microbacterium sp. 4R-513]QIG38493.1 hypothetical protein G5T42_02520 [Microbacterium sp. 4R-513]
MDADAAAELRSLRARAYGPDADIHDDPRALRRLEELERLARPPGGEDPEDVSPAEPERSAASAVIQAPTVDQPTLEQSEDIARPDPPRSRRLRWWVPSLWFASLVVVAVLAGVWTLTTTLTIFTPIQRDADGHQVAVLEVDPDFVMPQIFGTTSPGYVGFHEFYGLTVVATPGSWVGGYDNDGKCLLLVRTTDIDDDHQVVNGPIFNGCSAGSFPATVELVVSRELPDEVRERFPEGSALQFVLDGDRVGVFSDTE